MYDYNEDTDNLLDESLEDWVMYKRLLGVQIPFEKTSHIYMQVVLFCLQARKFTKCAEIRYLLIKE